jgi:hypothetical protein
VCLWCDKRKKKERLVRGCHERCYRFLDRQIKANRATENQLIFSGALLPAGKGGRATSQDSVTKFEALMNKLNEERDRDSEDRDPKVVAKQIEEELRAKLKKAQEEEEDQEG